MKPASWKESGQFFTSDPGHQIFFKVEGEGPPLILIHGFPTCTWDWHKIWPKLAQEYKLMSLDMLGFGYSDKPVKHTYSILDQADIWEEFLDQQEIGHCHVVAHDYGDTVAQELMARQLESRLSFKIHSVCLLNGGIFPEAHQARVIQTMMRSRLGFLLVPFLNRAALSRNFKAIFGSETQPSESEIDHFYELIEHNGGRNVLHKLIRYMDERVDHRERWVNALQHFDEPLKLINGLMDPISGQLMVDRFKQIVPDADVAELETIGHYPQMEAPEILTNHLFDWLGSVN